MKKLLIAVSIACAATPAFAQSASQALKLFEAGQYQRVVDQASPDADPSVIYTAAQSQQKLGNNDGATQTYAMLAGHGEDDPWHFIGLSGQQLLQEDVDGASASAQQAVSMNGDLAEAHYQLGLVLAKRQDWANAATEFDRVSELNPSNAYAQYYGGLMYYRANRPDRMANHF